MGVNPGGQKMNRANVPMKLGGGSGKDTLYCGRYVGNLPGSDGRCGPTNGPNCPDCKDYKP
jgi:hypothetical protein